MATTDNRSDNDIALEELFDFDTPDSAETEASEESPGADSARDAADTDETEGTSSAESVATAESTDADSSDDNIPETQKADDETATPAEPAPASESDPLAELRKQNEALQQQLQTVVQQMAAMQKPSEQKPAEQQPEQQEADDSVILQMPQELVALLESEDPNERVQGFNYLASSTATAAVAKVKEMLTPVFQQVLPRMIEHVTAQQQSRKSVFEDFYGKYPALNQPQFKGLVLATARDVAKQRGTTGWSPELRDAIGEAVMKQLAQALPASVTNPPAPQPRRGAPPPTPRGASPARTGNGQPSQEQYIDDLFN